MSLTNHEIVNRIVRPAYITDKPYNPFKKNSSTTFEQARKNYMQSHQQPKARTENWDIGQRSLPFDQARDNIMKATRSTNPQPIQKSQPIQKTQPTYPRKKSYSDLLSKAASERRMHTQPESSATSQQKVSFKEDREKRVGYKLGPGQPWAYYRSNKDNLIDMNVGYKVDPEEHKIGTRQDGIQIRSLTCNNIRKKLFAFNIINNLKFRADVQRHVSNFNIDENLKKIDNDIKEEEKRVNAKFKILFGTYDNRRTEALQEVIDNHFKTLSTDQEILNIIIHNGHNKRVPASHYNKISMLFKEAPLATSDDGNYESHPSLQWSAPFFKHIALDGTDTTCENPQQFSQPKFVQTEGSWGDDHLFARGINHQPDILFGRKGQFSAVLSPSGYMAQLHFLVWSTIPEDYTCLKHSEEFKDRLKDMIGMSKGWLKAMGLDHKDVTFGFHFPPSVYRIHMHVLVGNLTGLALGEKYSYHNAMRWYPATEVEKLLNMDFSDNI